MFLNKETAVILTLGYDRHDLISFVINCRLHFWNAVKLFHSYWCCFIGHL